MLLGIDLGTSSVKCLLASADGQIQHVAEREYPIDYPHPDHAEQDPEIWWSQTAAAVRELVALAAGEPIRAIGLSGQMHGTVLLDGQRRPLAPAVIWADRRSNQECRQIQEQIGLEELVRTAGSAPFPGFMLPTLLWFKAHRPDLWRQVRHALFPKDYLRLRLTGAPALEPTDASSGLILDARSRRPAADLLEQLAVDPGLFPPLLEPAAVAGALTPAAAADLNLPAGIPVVAGAADQAAGLLGSGVRRPGQVALSLGTGGTLVAPLRSFQVDPALGLHTFCDLAPNSWYLQGALLGGGLSFRWLRDEVLGLAGAPGFEEMTRLAADVPAGAGRLLFLPYLAGERQAGAITPTRALFFGLTPEHGRGHLARAVMEGTVFAFRRLLEQMEPLGVAPAALVASGGGMNSPLWRQIAADALGLPLTLPAAPAQSALGAAVLAGVGCGLYADLDEGAAAQVRVGEPVALRPAHKGLYDDLFAVFGSLLDHLAPDFSRLAAV